MSCFAFFYSQHNICFCYFDCYSAMAIDDEKYCIVSDRTVIEKSGEKKIVHLASELMWLQCITICIDMRCSIATAARYERFGVRKNGSDLILNFIEIWSFFYMEYFNRCDIESANCYMHSVGWRRFNNVSEI